MIALFAIAFPAFAAVPGPSIGDAQFETGALIKSSSSSSPMPAARRLRIAQAVTEQLTIANEGAPARYFLSCDVSGDQGFARRLHIVVRDAGGATLYRGPAARLRTISVGRIPSGVSEHLRVQFSLESSGSAANDNALQARAASLTLSYTASQA